MNSVQFPIVSTPNPEYPLLERPTQYGQSPGSSPPSLTDSEESIASVDDELPQPRQRRASTQLISQNAEDIRRLMGESGTKLVQRVCCGGGCCFMQSNTIQESMLDTEEVVPPDNDAYRSLQLRINRIPTALTNVVELPRQTISLEKVEGAEKVTLANTTNTPEFVTPHPPYKVHSAQILHARELTKPGAEKRTYHFDLDVSDYPAESGDVDFVVGGAIGVCAPNADEVVDDLFDLLLIPRYIRDRQVLVRTESGRWPTIWGDDKARDLLTTRRELLTWCSDLQSYPPNKPLLRLLAEYATGEEKKILMYLSSAQGQGAFCDLRTGPYITVNQLLHAFPSSKPPIAHLLSTLQTLMPRFYSLSNDPRISSEQDGCSKVIEIAVTVHEKADWRGGSITGVGSGFFERLAQKFIDADEAGHSIDLRVPMFRGLMQNPLAREFVADGPMLLIGAGVGVAPFRGFVHRRLRNANCANKVWVLQGIRDSLVDELYSGEWGIHEDKVKTVVQSRRGEGQYVQEEVRHQADLVWHIINALDGRVFVCGSSKGMGEGVEESLIDVAMKKGNLNREEAKAFWKNKNKAGQYIAETW